MDAFGIFEGGGVKGLAHIGALAAAKQNKNINFIGVAGTSAGSIVAALIAAGYSANELYDPVKTYPRGILDVNYLEFFDTARWENLKVLASDAKNLFGFGNVSQINALRFVKTWIRLPIFYFRNLSIISNLAKERGIFSTDKFASWLETRLAARLVERFPDLAEELSANGARVLFKHMPMPLKIIATDLTNQTIRVYSTDHQDDQERSVVDAVAASISIPFFFQPHRCPISTKNEYQTDNGSIELVDGGLLSNFPAWVFDRERHSSAALTPTFGFKFVVQDEASGYGTNLLGFARNLAITALSGDEQLQSRQIENLHIIPLRVDTKTLELDLAKDDRGALYDRGFNCSMNFFKQYVGPVDDKEMETRLEIIHTYLLTAIKKTLKKNRTIHLRVCILVPVGMYKDRLKVIYRYNFQDTDTDDQLELGGLDVGAAGQCWKTEDLVICDMASVRDLSKVQPDQFRAQWRLTKYEQALVRKGLRSCLCLPIPKGEGCDFDKGNKLLGVLSIDSDNDLLAAFRGNEGHNDIVVAAKESAQLISQWLTSSS